MIEALPEAQTKAREPMFARILVAIDDFSQSQAVLDLAKGAATEGVTEVRALHLRVRELSGLAWYTRESGRTRRARRGRGHLRAAHGRPVRGRGVRYAAVDRVAEAILAEAEEFGADLIVLGRPRAGKVPTRLFGSVTLRVIRRSGCPVLVAQRKGPPGQRSPSRQGLPPRAASESPARSPGRGGGGRGAAGPDGRPGAVPHQLPQHRRGAGPDAGRGGGGRERDRLAGILAAVSAAAWFDFFLTRPYERFTITRTADLETTVLILVIGVAVTELAVWGRRQHLAASRRAATWRGSTRRPRRWRPAARRSRWSTTWPASSPGCCRYVRAVSSTG